MQMSECQERPLSPTAGSDRQHPGQRSEPVQHLGERCSLLRVVWLLPHCEPVIHTIATTNTTDTTTDGRNTALPLLVKPMQHRCSQQEFAPKLGGCGFDPQQGRTKDWH